MSSVSQLQALILAGGKSTRLSSFVNDRPKPMAQIGDKPFLAWLILSLKHQGIREVILEGKRSKDRVLASSPSKIPKIRGRLTPEFNVAPSIPDHLAGSFLLHLPPELPRG